VRLVDLNLSWEAIVKGQILSVVINWGNCRRLRLAIVEWEAKQVTRPLCLTTDHCTSQQTIVLYNRPVCCTMHHFASQETI